MSTVRVYKSTDPGAPAHPSATRGSMAALLRACLVTGYGSGENFKAPAGWEEPFDESGNIAVFRALEGARQFFQIDDTQSNAIACQIRAYESMSGVAEGSGLWCTDYFGKLRHSSYNTWVLIADERTVYLFLQTSAGMVPHAFGEFDSMVSDDPYNSLCSGHGSPAGLPLNVNNSVRLGYPTGLGNVLWGFCVHKNALNSVLGPLALLVTDVSSASSAMGGVGGADNPSDVPGLNYMVSRCFLGCNTSVENNKKYVRGALRGAYAPWAAQPLAHLGEYTDPATAVTYLAVNFYVYTGNIYRHGQFWFKISGGW